MEVKAVFICVFLKLLIIKYSYTRKGKAMRCALH